MGEKQMKRGRDLPVQRGGDQAGHHGNKPGLAGGAIGQQGGEGLEDGDDQIQHLLGVVVCRVGAGAQQPVEEAGRDARPQGGDAGLVVSQGGGIVEERLEQGEPDEALRVVGRLEQRLDEIEDGVVRGSGRRAGQRGGQLHGAPREAAPGAWVSGRAGGGVVDVVRRAWTGSRRAVVCHGGGRAERVPEKRKSRRRKGKQGGRSSSSRSCCFVGVVVGRLR